MEIRPEGVGRKTDGQTDTTKLVVAFRKFANAPETIFRIDIVISHMPRKCLPGLPNKIKYASGKC